MSYLHASLVSEQLIPIFMMETHFLINIMLTKLREAFKKKFQLGNSPKRWGQFENLIFYS